MTDELFDAIVIGGGAAGLAGALTLARARRRVLVIDAGRPRNARAEEVHGFLTREGISPAEVVATGRAEVEHYGGTVVEGEVLTVRRAEDRFEIGYRSSAAVASAAVASVIGRRLLVTTGLVDELPPIPGVRELWGSGVVHCPYCHGWEVRDQPIGVLGGPMAVHRALMWRQWSDDVVLFTDTGAEPTAEEAEQLTARGIGVVDGAVEALEITEGRLDHVLLADGRQVPRRAMNVPTRMVARSHLLADLGLTPADHPSGMGEYIPAEPTGQTSVAGVWVAGNVTDLAAQVISAAAGGNFAGAMINMDLITEDTRLAVEHSRSKANS